MKKVLMLILLTALIYSCKKYQVNVINSPLIGRWYYTADTVVQNDYNSSGAIALTKNLNYGFTYNHTDYIQFNSDGTTSGMPGYNGFLFSLNGNMIKMSVPCCAVYIAPTITIETLTTTNLKLLIVDVLGDDGNTGYLAVSTETAYFSR